MSGLLSFLGGSVAETVQGWRHWNPGSFDLSPRASVFKIASCSKMFAGGIQCIKNQKKSDPALHSS